ncbi:uncharacterized protein LOC123910455 [Trifolium pratense]|uniref:uncharacterized protein LOC123910455 n=1 Tax=Trifolium pratense TaxID=57577 RepID=UPI001E6955B5|nr:uncharacterized protein LOC123910455 [Trifolium pratense]
MMIDNDDLGHNCWYSFEDPFPPPSSSPTYKFTVIATVNPFGYEEGMLWLPSYVLDEVCMSNRDQNQKVLNQQKLVDHKSFGESQSQYSKSTSRLSYQRLKLANCGVGNGMRAIFLEPSHGSCGTGVFLPQRADTKFQPRKKPACAPVLLPARVVQALNINVHALGVQISPPKAQKYKPRCGEVYNNNSTEMKNDGKDASKQCSFISQKQCSSQGIFLPKEWTY